MTRAAALVLLVTLAFAGAVGAAPLATGITPGDDVRRTILVGPSGQVWEPDGEGAWTRSAAGGVAADVQGALVAEDLIVAGKATPLYRRKDDAWYGLRLGERGRTIAGTGPRPAIAIGKSVFVWTRGRWTRVATADRPVVALWAASDRKVHVATDRAVLRLAGKRFVPHQPVAVVAFGGGDSPLGRSADGAVYDITARAALSVTVDGQPVTAEAVTTAGGSPWVVGRAAGQRVLVRRTRAGWDRRPLPPLADEPVVHLAVDRAGRVLVATAGGGVHLGAADGTWTRGTLTTRLPEGTPGPGPARMP